ncbi:dTDP-4-dehydrorhamnose reductase [Aestuariibius sp. 2305UL40-4]|uniref:dTDP-4-dehydrorhamnose reductase n=1 Tax=Aestuariibius violaceus TaxID=3234132 RepID=UPI00345EFF02
MKVVAFGRSGQVARALAALGAECHGRESADFGDPAGVAEVARGLEADAFVNAAAYTAVDAAEENAAEAQRINADSVGALARVAAERGIPLVHISTDYVFDGSGAAPWAPDAPVSPLGAYGRTKLAGEVALREAGGTHAILRTSWVFSATGANFVKTMLRVGADRPLLRVVADQIGGPTPADAIAAACIEIAGQLREAPEKTGTYHFSGAPDTSWAGFAREIFAVAGMDTQVEEIPSAEYPTPAARPLNSRLDCSATEAAFGIARPDWRAALGRVLEELK